MSQFNHLVPSQHGFCKVRDYFAQHLDKVEHILNPLGEGPDADIINISYIRNDFEYVDHNIMLKYTQQVWNEREVSQVQ